MILEIYILLFPETYILFPENIYLPKIHAIKNINISENIDYINLKIKQNSQKMFTFNRMQTQQVRAQRFRNQIKCMSFKLKAQL